MKSKYKNYFIAVNGLIGSGKTTFTELLAKELKARLFKEKPEQNPFLPLYYKNPQRWALASQIFFLSEKIGQLRRIEKEVLASNIVQDMPIYQDFFTFVGAQRVLGYLNLKEYELCLRLFEMFRKNIPKPDLIINLDVSFPDLKERIRTRGRSYEKNIDFKYLKTLYRLQNKWIKNAAHFNLRIVSIKAGKGKNDILLNKNYKKDVIKKIRSVLTNRSSEKTFLK